MPNNVPLHGNNKPTAREVQRETNGRSLDWRFPKTIYRESEDRPGTLICPSCHAISTEKRWFLDEARYQELRDKPDVKLIICPGCERVERGLFDGRVLLSGSFLEQHKDEIMNLIRNEEDKARQTNPFSRVGSTDDRGDHMELLVTTQWLAERIGKELRKAYRGELQINHEGEDAFSFVRWHRE